MIDAVLYLFYPFTLIYFIFLEIALESFLLLTYLVLLQVIYMLICACFYLFTLIYFIFLGIPSCYLFTLFYLYYFK